jgi:hypothetical protein
MSTAKLRATLLILTFLGTLLGLPNSRTFASQPTPASTESSWRHSIRTRLYSADALETKNIETTNELIESAFAHEDATLVGEIADMLGSHIVTKPEWREKLVRSPRLSSLLLERLSLLLPKGNLMCDPRWEPQLCSEALASLHRKSPNLLGLYRQLAAAKSAGHYLQIVPPGARAKSEFVRQAVRSTLDIFLNLKPSSDQIRTLALWMHDFDLLFYIQDRATRRVRTASEFLLLTDFYYLPPSDAYRARVRSFLRTRLREFKALRPNAAELLTFQQRIAGSDVDQNVLVTSLNEAQDAADFVRAASAAIQSAKGAERDQMRQVLSQNISRFSELEPNVDQLNSYRTLMKNGRSDLELLRYIIPKIYRAQDFLKIVRLFGDVRVRRTDVYSEGLRQVMLDSIDTFLALSPTTDEINGYREKMMDPTGDLVLLRAGIERVRNSREFLLLATHFGNEPSLNSSLFDFVATQALVENLDKFISLNPSMAEISYYRARMANPKGDLRLVEYALRIASTKAQMIEIVGRRPMVNTAEFRRDWSSILKKNFSKFEGMKPSLGDYALYLQAITDDQISAELRRRINR